MTFSYSNTAILAVVYFELIASGGCGGFEYQRRVGVVVGGVSGGCLGGNDVATGVSRIVPIHPCQLP